VIDLIQVQPAPAIWFAVEGYTVLRVRAGRPAPAVAME